MKVQFAEVDASASVVRTESPARYLGSCAGYRLTLASVVDYRVLAFLTCFLAPLVVVHSPTIE